MSFLKKRAVCAVLAAAMALSFTACGGSEGGEEAEAEYTYAEQGGSISLPEGLAAPEENGSTNTLLEAGQLSGRFTAVNYTATGYFTHSGSVTVTVSGESSQEGTQWTDAFISLWKQGDKAYVSVKDHGETIPPSELNLIFDRFHKTDRSRSLDREGVGLGLYIVKTILGNHNEDISVTSADGVTEFVFTLTLCKQPQKQPGK